MDDHKKCKRDVLKNLEKISYILYKINCMKRDDCPSLKDVFEADLVCLSGVVDNIRRTITK